jgi:hypothetical protein
MGSANTGEQDAKVLRGCDQIWHMRVYHQMPSPLEMQSNVRCEAVCSDIKYCHWKCVCQIKQIMKGLYVVSEEYQMGNNTK